MFLKQKQKTKTKLKFSTTYGKNYVNILYYVLCIMYYVFYYVSSISMMIFGHNKRTRKFLNTFREKLCQIIKTATADVFFKKI